MTCPHEHIRFMPASRPDDRENAEVWCEDCGLRKILLWRQLTAHRHITRAVLRGILVSD